LSHAELMVHYAEILASEEAQEVEGTRTNAHCHRSGLSISVVFIEPNPPSCRLPRSYGKPRPESVKDVRHCPTCLRRLCPRIGSAGVTTLPDPITRPSGYHDVYYELLFGHRGGRVIGLMGRWFCRLLSSSPRPLCALEKRIDLQNTLRWGRQQVYR
jgi:hypothetical protein